MLKQSICWGCSVNSKVSFFNTTLPRHKSDQGIRGSGMSPSPLQFTHNFLLPSDSDSFCLIKPISHACQQTLEMVSIAHFPPTQQGGIEPLTAFLPATPRQLIVTSQAHCLLILTTNCSMSSGPQRWHLYLNLPFLSKIKDESVWAYGLRVQSLMAEKAWW